MEVQSNLDNKSWSSARSRAQSGGFSGGTNGPLGRVREWCPLQLVGMWGAYPRKFLKKWCKMVHWYLNSLKPQSDIRCNRFATSPRLTIYTNRRGRNKVPDRSLRGSREVSDWSGTSLLPNQSQRAQKPGCDWFGRRQVPAKSPTSPRSVADRSPTNFVRIGAWLSLKLVGNRSATNRGLLRDLTATSRRPARNCSKMYSIS